MMERRSEIRKILDFEEFPLHADFFSGVEYRFYGHIQNISPGGLCIMLLNTYQASPPNIKGNLHLIYLGKTRSVPAVIKWIDKPHHFLRYVGLEVKPEDLEPVLKEFFPDLLSNQ
jgi:hypothetical protein